MSVADFRVPGQAAGLRRSEGALSVPSSVAPPPLLVVASGKGGVGKTFLSIHLALALAERRPGAALIDLDWGLANLDVALGLAPRRHLGHVLAGECAVADVLVDSDGLTLLPNACGETNYEASRAVPLRDLAAAIVAARPDCRLVLADTHPGIGAPTVDVIRQADLSVVVSTTEPTAITDTYALLKVLSQTPPPGPVGLVINQASSPERAFEAAQHLNAVSRRFLGWDIPCWGYVLRDPAVPQSIHRQRPLWREAPRGRTAQTLREIAATLEAILEKKGGAG